MRPPSEDFGAVRRIGYGPRPIGALLPRVTRAAFRSKGAVSARLMADWPEIVGASLAGMTAPRRFGAGTLAINCSGPTALELQHASGPLMERINMHLGQAVVKRLRFVQELAPVAVAVPRAAPRRAPICIDGMAEGPLRDALAALGALVKAGT